MFSSFGYWLKWQRVNICWLAVEATNKPTKVNKRAALSVVKFIESCIDCCTVFYSGVFAKVGDARSVADVDYDDAGIWLLFISIIRAAQCVNDVVHVVNN